MQDFVKRCRYISFPSLSPMAVLILRYHLEKCFLVFSHFIYIFLDALTEVFRKMHFLVEERRDLLGSDWLNTIKEYSEKDHSEMDAFVCCILSHGEKGTVFGVDGKPVQIRDLTQPFTRCSTLTGKPKLFFIQACQGSELQKGVLRQDGTEDDEYEEDATGTVLSRVPIEADFLIGMATVESYKSFRHTVAGSIYIQELCKHLTLGCPR